LGSCCRAMVYPQASPDQILNSSEFKQMGSQISTIKSIAHNILQAKKSGGIKLPVNHMGNIIGSCLDSSTKREIPHLNLNNSWLNADLSTLGWLTLPSGKTWTWIDYMMDWAIQLVLIYKSYLFIYLFIFYLEKKKIFQIKKQEGWGHTPIENRPIFREPSRVPADRSRLPGRFWSLAHSETRVQCNWEIILKMGLRDRSSR
jgi:hypothetical protein